jgi:hypothetical protein
MMGFFGRFYPFQGAKLLNLQWGREIKDAAQALFSS